MYRLLIQSPVVGRACANCVGICARLRFTFFVSFTTGATNLPPPCGRGAPAGRVVLVAGATPGGAAPAPLMLTGEVHGAELTLGTGHTVATVKAALRPLSLFVR